MDASLNGDKRSAFEKRLVAFYPRLYPLALRLCQNAADAHDLVQDTVETRPALARLCPQPWTRPNAGCPRSCARFSANGIAARPPAPRPV